jgi:hypothetical protein
MIGLMVGVQAEIIWRRAQDLSAIHFMDGSDARHSERPGSGLNQI